MLSWVHIGLAGSFGALLVSGCGAQAVSRKTPTYFIFSQTIIITFAKVILTNTGLAEVRESEHDRHDNLHRPQHLLLHRILYRRYH